MQVSPMPVRASGLGLAPGRRRGRVETEQLVAIYETGRWGDMRVRLARGYGVRLALERCAAGTNRVLKTIWEPEVATSRPGA